MGELAAPCASSLVALLKDDEFFVREAGAHALGKLGKRAASHAQDLVALLREHDEEDEDPDVQAAVVLALGQMGEAILEHAHELLGALLKETDLRFRETISTALRSVADDSASSLACLDQDSVHEGRAAQITVLLACTDSKSRIFAANILEGLGPAVVPHIAALLKHQEPEVQNAASDVIKRIGVRGSMHAAMLAALLKDPEEGVQLAAARALGSMGRLAALHVAPFLRDEDRTVREAAVEALSAMDPADGAPAAVQLLRDTKASVREAAAEALAVFGTSAAPHVAALLGDESARTAAEEILEQLGVSPEDALVARARLPSDGLALQQCRFASEKDDEDGEGRITVQLERATVCPQKNPILDDDSDSDDGDEDGKDGKITVKLERVTVFPSRNPVLDDDDDLDDGDDDEALHALPSEQAPKAGDDPASPPISLRPDPQGAVQQSRVLTVLKAVDPETWRGSAQALESTDSDEAVSCCVTLLQHESAEVREAAAQTLATVDGEKMAKITEDLAASLHDPNWKVRLATARTLGSLGDHVTEKQAEQLTSLLRDNIPEVRVVAIQAIASMGQVASPFVAQLLQHADASIRAAATKALGGAGPAAVPHALALLSHPTPNVRQAAAEALVLLGSAAAPHVAELSELLGDHVPGVRIAASRFLVNLGGATAAWWTTPHLQSKDLAVRVLAAQTLAEFGELAVPHAADLDALLWDSQWQARSAALIAFGKIGAAAALYADDIAWLLEDDDDDVKKAAARALELVAPNYNAAA